MAQAPYLKLASNLGLEFTSFWATNVILLKHVDLNTLSEFTRMTGEFQLREQHTVSVPAVREMSTLSVDQGVQWGVEKVRAPEAWGVTQGENVAVGSIDTGVNLAHEAFVNNFAGAWRDPFYNSSTPNDVQGHGSHTLGVIVGQTNGIGVAPGI